MTPEQHAERMRRWRENPANREKTRAWAKRYRKANPDRVNASQRAWRAANSERASGYTERWRAAHPEEVKARYRRWSKTEKGLTLARAKTARRRARKYAAFVEEVEGVVVWLRDSATCHICREAVSFYRMELDHVVPLSRGGTHSYSNVRAAHSDCNRWKSDRPMESLREQR